MRRSAGIAIVAVVAFAAVTGALVAARAADAAIERGKYLVTIMGCGDCHTPGSLRGKPDMARFLGGSEVAFEVPGLGAFAGSNLTPDKATGIGTWTTAQIVTALRTGTCPDGRVLAPPMPWRDFATLSTEDATAIALFLGSIPPVTNLVAGPFAPGQKVSSYLSRILPPGATAAEAK